MSLSILVTVEVTAATDEKGNTITAQSGIAEGTAADIRRLANEAASRASAAITADVRTTTPTGRPLGGDHA